jgi:ABC-type sugar transport system ATPase subunit
MTLGDRAHVMRRRLLQQVDTPIWCYPTRIPQAYSSQRFIGSRPMNSFRSVSGTTYATDALPGDDAARGARCASGSKAARQSGRGSSSVGIATESTSEDARSRTAGDVRGTGLSFRANVDVVESMGSRAYYASFSVKTRRVQSVRAAPSSAKDAAREEKRDDLR